MIYITSDGNEIIKYEITIDEKKLNNLKYKIIGECGHITRYLYEDTRCQHCEFSYTYVRNFSKDFVRGREYNDFYSFPEDVFRYQYDLYEDTPLTLLINRLLEGDSSVISLLEHPEKENLLPGDSSQLPEEFKNLLNQEIDTISPWKLQQLSKKLEEYQTNQKLNQDRKSDIEYYPEVLKCITKTEVLRMRQDALQQIYSLLDTVDSLIQEVKPFFEDAKETQMALPGYQKVLKVIREKESE